jgi:glycosyltransferase involved in cell wall biosynthesis
MEQGADVTIAALDWSPIVKRSGFLKTFPLGHGPRRLGRSPAMHRWLRERAQGRSMDLLHNNGLWMMPNVYPGCVARRYSVPLVVSPRGTLAEWAFRRGSSVKRVFWPFMQQPALAVTTCFHATGESEYEDIRRMGFRQAVAVVPNGIDIPPSKEARGAMLRTLLFLGRVHPIKGLDLLLRAWQVVSPRFPEWRLRIVGPDDRGYHPRMQSLAAQLRLERLEFCGPLYGDSKLEAYREADLFVLPTHSESFGMAVAEALAAGTPAIVSKGAPWNGLGSHGAGWWIDMGLDPLVACLEKALRCSPGELRAMGERGRMWMEEDFCWLRIGEMMARTYRWILAGGPAPSWVRDG